MITAPEPALYQTIFAIFASLVAGSISRFIALRNAEEKVNMTAASFQFRYFSEANATERIVGGLRLGRVTRQNRQARNETRRPGSLIHRQVPVN